MGDHYMAYTCPTNQLLASTLTTTTVMRTGNGDSTVQASTGLVSVPEAGQAGRQVGITTSHFHVDTIQQLASPQNTTTTGRTGAEDQVWSQICTPYVSSFLLCF